jgi:hypothetical protein
VPELLTERAVHQLLDAGRAVVSQLDLDTVLQQVVKTGAAITGARYAAPPRGHPSMEAFLGVPLLIRGERTATSTCVRRTVSRSRPTTNRPWWCARNGRPS